MALILFGRSGTFVAIQDFLRRCFLKRRVSSFSGVIKPSSLQSYCSTVSSSTVSASGKLQLPISWHRKPKSPHCSLTSGLLCSVCFFCTELDGVRPTNADTLSCAVGPLLFIHNGLLSDDRKHNICTKIKLIRKEKINNLVSWHLYLFGGLSTVVSTCRWVDSCDTSGRNAHDTNYVHLWPIPMHRKHKQGN